MDDFPGLMARDFGFRSQGKSAPMSASKSSSSLGSGSAFSRSNPLASFDDVFVGAPRYPNPSQSQPPPPSFDSIFDGFKDSNPNPKSSSMPVYDKPVYDDDIFDGVPGIKSSAKVEYDDVFASISKGQGHVDDPGTYDDLLGSFGRSSSSRAEPKKSENLSGFEELIPGFGGSSPPSRREPPDGNQQKSAVPLAKPFAAMPEDPFVVVETTSTSAYPSSGVFTDPLEHLGRSMNSGSAHVDASPASGRMFDEIDAFDGLAKSVPIFTSENNESRKDKSPLRSGPNRSQERSSMESFDNVIPKTRSSKFSDSRSSVQIPSSNDKPFERNATADQSSRSSVHLETADDVWLTVTEIPLFTQLTSAPPPSRPAPPLVIKSSPYGKTDPRRNDNDSYSQTSPSYPYPSARRPGVSPIDELEDFAMGKPQSNERAEVFSSEDDIETNSAAAASMKEVVYRAEAKFKHAKEVRERERDARSARSREFAQKERDGEVTPDSQDLEDKEKQEKLDRERLQREREEREREQRRLEKEREEREKARQAVERATREARERAAAEARAKLERAAVEKANAEARQRLERAAVQRAAGEARERAAAGARQKAEKAAAEARERATADAREKAAKERERAAVERAAAEARLRAERAAVGKVQNEARERAAAAAREKQKNTENDFESFFGTRATSAPKERGTTLENIFDTPAQNRDSADGAFRASSTSSTIRKASSTTNIVDDLTSIFGAPSSGEFQDVEGETEERRRARLERHQRTLERAAKALAEKNERDMQTQREQAERHRISETLDIEIKRWAAGKEGNLRALLSTLQYVLWPECGWQAVSLTDLITAAAVKKVYRKATLCIHPDKVQQKGANLQQKYIAEKVFDLLKEAWNKLNSEELF